MSKGDGSIIQRSRGVWEVQISLGRDPATGKYRKVSRTVRGTKADARKMRDQLRVEYESGLRLDADKLELGSYLNDWIGNREASGELAHATIENYRRHIRTWINPYLGKSALKEIRPYTVESWHREARKAGATPRTLQAAHKVLKQALRDAMRNELILSNPCDAVKTPKAEARKRGYLEVSELRRMLAVLDAEGESAFSIAVRLGVSTGARRGEVLGLTWEHVDFKNKAISIVQSLSQYDGARKAGKPAKEIKRPKTQSGKRKISLDDDVLVHLSKWKAIQARELLKNGIKQSSGTPVCCSLYDARICGVAVFAGGFLDPQGFSSKFAKFCEEYGFYSSTGKRLCFHELRHTQATLLLSNGEDIISVAGRMGHASPSITSDMYAHAMPEKDRECANLIGNITKNRSAGKILEIEVKSA